MATAILLKTMPNPKLPLQCLRNPISVVTRAVAPFPQPEVTNEVSQLSLNKASSFPLSGLTQKLYTGELDFVGVRNEGFALTGTAVFYRQIGVGRSSRREDDEDEEDVVDDDEDKNEDKNEDDVDNEDEGMEIDDEKIDLDKYEDFEEEENPKTKRKKTYRSRW